MNVIKMIKEGCDKKIVSQKFNVPFQNIKKWLEIGGERKKGSGFKIADM